MSHDRSIFGVCVELAQRLPFSPCELAKDGLTPETTPHYTLFSHFDEMRIEIVDQVKGYLEESVMQTTQASERIYTPCEIRRLFLYCVAEDGSQEAAKKQRRFLVPEDPDLHHEKPLIALVGIKMNGEFFQKTQNTCCTASKCIRTFLQRKNLNGKPLVENVDFCILCSMGPDDMYVLLRGNNPIELMELIYELRAHQCKREGCENVDPALQAPCCDVATILETYTHFGFWHDIDTSAIAASTQPFSFELQLQLYAGATLERADLRKIKQLFTMTSLQELATTGRYSLLLRGDITLSNLFKLYKLPFIDWHFCEHYKKRVHFSMGRFIYEKQKLPGKKLDDWIFEAQEKAVKWLREEHERLDGILPQLIAIGYDVSDSRVSNLIKLHKQGCRRLFETFRWGEFIDVRHFFTHFFTLLSQELGAIQQYQKAGSPLFERYAAHLMRGIQEFTNKMSVVLNDRLVLGMPMQENTRPGVYAAGAYEDIIQCYRMWALELRDLYENLPSTGKTQRRLHFLIVPIEKSDIKSMKFFVMGEATEIAVGLEMGFEDMLSFEDTLVALIHELGHYSYIFDRSQRIDTYLRLVATKFVIDLVEQMRHFFYPSLDVGIASNHAAELISAMEKYLREMVLIYQGNPKGAKLTLDRVSVFCTDATLALLDSFATDQLKIDRIRNFKSIKHTAQRDLMKALIDLYDTYDVFHMIAPQGMGFYHLLMRAMDAAILECREVLRECHADLLAIHTLNLTSSQFLSILLRRYEKRDKGAYIHSVETRNHRWGDAVRVVSALFQIALRKSPSLNSQALLDEALEQLVAADLEATWVYYTWNAQLQEDAKTLLKELDAASSSGWNNLLRKAFDPYLYSSGQQFMRDEIALRDDVKTMLRRIRNLYTEIYPKTNSMEQLDGLLQFMQSHMIRPDGD